MKDVIVLSHRGKPLREFVIGKRPLRVGRGAGQDVVVHDVAVPDEALVIERARGELCWRDVSSPTRRGRLEVGDILEVGSHRLERVRNSDAPIPIGRTEPLGLDTKSESGFALLVYCDEVRRYALSRRAITVGSAADNDVVIRDRSVSRHHCRLEATASGVVVSDLGSRNGTRVDGKRLLGGAEVRAGAVVEVGTTEMRLVPRGHRGDARGDGAVVAESPQMLAVLSDVEEVASLPYPALILGESGAGKEGIARALHDRGTRRKGPFVAVNAACFNPQLVASELFGHEAGAFTGAAGARKGAFELAHEGTLFLDEIGELPLELQARLLRVLDTWEVRRLGGEKTRRLDVRLVCATNRDPHAMVVDGSMRRDLYYRLNRLVLRVPPLRDRPLDVAPLVQHFKRRAEEICGQRQITDEALAILECHAWPGNVRELRNVVESCVSRSRGVIDARLVTDMLGPDAQPHRAAAMAMTRVLQRYDGNTAAAARALGMARSTFRDRLRKEQEEAA